MSGNLCSVTLQNTFGGPPTSKHKHLLADIVNRNQSPPFAATLVLRRPEHAVIRFPYPLLPSPALSMSLVSLLWVTSLEFPLLPYTGYQPWP
ncbi:Uncharacterized protein HZ326_31311 [Fusarium oxysporum f. sp. albedinis]|nr:Uncharacterized protein HZ326_31311 [Fusarium oxysporum f. sp. albedinis]